MKETRKKKVRPTGPISAQLAQPRALRPARWILRAARPRIAQPRAPKFLFPLSFSIFQNLSLFKHEYLKIYRNHLSQNFDSNL
jgi:hypothetical protein